MYSSQTYESIKARILDSITSSIDKREGSFVQDMISPIAVEITKAYIEMENILNITFVDSVYGEFLDRKAADFGVYRKAGAKASGIVKITGTNGTIIQEGTVAITDDGLKFILGGGTITNGTVNVLATAENVGGKYNVLPNTITSLEIDINGISSITNVLELTSGIDIESDDLLKERLLFVIQKPTTSGNIYHYMEWALEVVGVSNVKVVPLWNGPGTVKVIITDKYNQPVSSDIITNCFNNIENQRPIGATVTVVTPDYFEVKIGVDVSIDSTRTLEDITEDIRVALLDYFKTCENSIILTKVGSIISNVTGVLDYTNLKLNEVSENLLIPEEEIINLTELVVV